MELLILVGISGSGKSTFKKEFLKQHPDYLCINRDALRLSIVDNLDGYYQRKDIDALEQTVNAMTNAIMTEAFMRSFNVIIDNTNLRQKSINEFINFAGVKDFKFKLFNCNPVIAKARVMLRDHKQTEYEDSSVIEAVKYIDKQHENYKNIKEWIINTHPDKIIK